MRDIVSNDIGELVCVNAEFSSGTEGLFGTTELDAAAAAVPQLATGSVRAARTALDTASAALAVLDPQATLDRGYAIVRRATDGVIIRDPAEAPARTRLAVRVARGDLDATVDGGAS